MREREGLIINMNTYQHQKPFVVGSVVDYASNASVLALSVDPSHLGTQGELLTRLKNI